jgi:uncharacterized protein YdcH (DUF465 family)
MPRGLIRRFGRNAMVHRINKILSRFPENENAVCALIRDSSEFAALCQEFADADRDLEHLTRLTKRNAIVVVDALRKRRIALEEEILTRIEGYNPS